MGCRECRVGGGTSHLGTSTQQIGSRCTNNIEEPPPDHWPIIIQAGATLFAHVVTKHQSLRVFTNMNINFQLQKACQRL